jgi:hypothetical protein
MPSDRMEIRVALTDPSLDGDELATRADLLRGELADLDVDEVSPAVAGDAPPGAKGVELLALGALVVKLARSTKVLAEVVDTVREWLSRSGGGSSGSIRLEIDGDVLEIAGLSADERKALIDQWVQRHAEP